jgi:DNA ligase 4
LSSTGWTLSTRGPRLSPPKTDFYPYFSFHGTKSFIKLKKDHIAGLGDTADFAIVGGRRDARDEQKLEIGKLWWTSFYIGCLENKDDVRRFDAKPRFRIIDVVDRYGILKENILFLNRHGYFRRVPFDKSITEFDVGFEYGRQLQPAELFKRPFSVELMGAGFDKPANARYFVLRFPRVLKIHNDRSFKETISFEELQEMAGQCREEPENRETKEMHWLQRLRRSDYLVERSRPALPAMIPIMLLKQRLLDSAHQVGKAPDNRERRPLPLDPHIHQNGRSSVPTPASPR